MAVISECRSPLKIFRDNPLQIKQITYTSLHIISLDEITLSMTKKFISSQLKYCHSLSAKQMK